MKKNLFFAIVIALGFYTLDMFALTLKPYVTVVNKIDKSKAGDQDIWIHFDTLSSKCPHKCSYHRIKPGDEYTPLGSFFGNLLTVVTYVPDANGKIKKIKFPADVPLLSLKKSEDPYKAKTNRIEVYFDRATEKFTFKETGSAWKFSMDEVTETPEQ